MTCGDLKSKLKQFGFKRQEDLVNMQELLSSKLSMGPCLFGLGMTVLAIWSKPLYFWYAMFMLIWIPSQLMYERSVSCTIEMIELFLSFHIVPGSAVLFIKSSISYLQMAFIYSIENHWEVQWLINFSIVHFPRWSDSSTAFERWFWHAK